MARIFLTEEEAVDWGLKAPPKKAWLKYRKLLNSVAARVIGGVIVLVIVLVASSSKPAWTSILTSVQ